MKSIDPDDSLSPAEQLYSEWLQRRSQPDAKDFEALCSDNPTLARDLHALRDADELLAEALPQEHPWQPLLDRLSRRGRSRFRIEKEIGRGGMGIVFEAWDEDLRRIVALKIIRADTSLSAIVDARRLGRFLEEAQVTGQLEHPGIVPVYEIGVDEEGRIYFAMQKVEGETLKQVFEHVRSGAKEWTRERALNALLRTCEAVAFAHSRGVIHRDLKPTNVMVGSFGQVYVMDWGLARVLGNPDAISSTAGARSPMPIESVRKEASSGSGTPDLYTRYGDQVGTPAYMSPEQVSGDVGRVDRRSDVYALGVMLYELLAGQSPEANSANQPLRDRLEIDARDVPGELVAICKKALASDRDQRYGDTQALADDLRAYLETRVVRAYESGAWAEARKWVSRNKPLAASLAGAVLVLVAGLTASLIFKARADKNADLASRRADETTEQARIAASNEELATRKANDVLSLSAIQDLKDLEARTDRLWPAHPQNLGAYDAWLANARELVEGRLADPARGIKRKFSLAEHEAKLAEIRLRAKPLTSEQIEADVTASAHYAEWKKERAQLVWMRRMLGDEPWPSEAAVEAELAKENLPADANGLNDLAWSLVQTDPIAIVYGSEVRALVLAKRAVAMATESQRPLFRDTLAWALYRTGHLDAAHDEEQRAVAEIEAARKQEYEGYLAILDQEIAESTKDGAHSKRLEQASKLADHVMELERDVNERRTYDFDDAQDRWWHAQLARLVNDMKAFTDERSGGVYSKGTSENHGWGIPKRAEFARTIEERSVGGAEAKQRWDEAIDAIAKSANYGRLKMPPQLGLLPIGMDPDSHLWEFAHLQTGEVAQRAADGKLVLDEKMGLVFVLIPGGTFTLGAQSHDPAEANYDPRSQKEEMRYQVTLDAYFMSKYEMTQGQWERFAGRNPSYFGPHNYRTEWNRAGKAWNALHPVEQVSWNDCHELMRRLGLVLPTEAQWERGCRGSTSTVYWSGDDESMLVEVGNVSDQYAKRHGGAGWSVVHEAWDHGNTVPAEVGSYRANDLGLHDVHGNVWEWCRDVYGMTQTFAPGDGERQVTGATFRPTRGGCFYFAASVARSASRNPVTPEFRLNTLGLRPARAVAP